ncbi:MAG: porin family protein [Chitinophagaceae bacterium]
MKRISLITLFFSFLSVGYSQFVVFGVKGGLNLSTFTGNDFNKASFQPSFHIGGLANFLINENFMVQPEVMFSGKGAKADGNPYHLNYVNVPVLLQYKTPSGFFLEAGPQIGFLISAKLHSSDWKDNVKSTDYSWVAGLGYKSTMGLGVDVRYDFGFFNVANAGIIRNKTIQIGVFYTFGSGGEE